MSSFDILRCWRPILQFTLVVGAGTALTGCVTQRQLVRAEKPVVDVGEVFLGQRIRQPFTIINDTSAPVRLEVHSAPCGCTGVDLANNVIQAESSVEIALLFDASREPLGALDTAVQLRALPEGSNDGEQVFVLRLIGQVRSEVTPSAPQLDLGERRVGETAGASIDLSVDQTRNIELLESRTFDEGLKASLRKIVTPDGPVYRLAVVHESAKAVGAYVTAVSVSTSSSYLPEVLIPVRWVVTK